MEINHISTSLTTLCLLSSLLAASCNPALAAVQLTPKPAASTAFIRSRCNTTQFPQTCIASLSSYGPTIRNSPSQLAHAALSVSLESARSTSAMVAKMSSGAGKKLSPKEARAVSDCVDSLADSVDYLRQSMVEMGHIRGKDARLHINDVQTWVSTALTDEGTCTDGFGGDAAKSGAASSIRGRVVKVAKLTSNALALVNALASVE